MNATVFLGRCLVIRYEITTNCEVKLNVHRTGRRNATQKAETVLKDFQLQISTAV